MKRDKILLVAEVHHIVSYWIYQTLTKFHEKNVYQLLTQWDACFNAYYFHTMPDLKAFNSDNFHRCQ
jgi:hypothetical protein